MRTQNPIFRLERLLLLFATIFSSVYLSCNPTCKTLESQIFLTWDFDADNSTFPSFNHLHCVRSYQVNCNTGDLKDCAFEIVGFDGLGDFNLASVPGNHLIATIDKKDSKEDDINFSINSTTLGGNFLPKCPSYNTMEVTSGSGKILFSSITTMTLKLSFLDPQDQSTYSATFVFNVA